MSSSSASPNLGSDGAIGDHLSSNGMGIVKKHKIWILSLFALSLVVLYVICTTPVSDSSIYTLLNMEHGDRIQLKSALDGTFVRVETNFEPGDGGRKLDEIGTRNRLVMTDTVGYLHGSTFFVEKYGECFYLKAGNGKYVKVHSENILLASADSQFSADTFSAVLADHNEPMLASTGMNVRSPYSNYRRRLDTIKPMSNRVLLKTCAKNEWFQQNIGALVGGKPAGIVGINVNSDDDAQDSSNGGWMGNGGPAISTESHHSIFELIKIEQHRGVNMGGMFIPEVWMTPSFFNGTLVEGKVLDRPLAEDGKPLGWGGSLCRMTIWNREDTEARMEHRFKTWFTESDFKEIAALGYTSVRLPVGYWNIIEDPYKLFAPTDYKVGRAKIDWCFDMAAKYGLTVLLDMHGAPGGQNGQDHSGCTLPENWMSNENRDLSLKTVEAMAERYSSRPNLYGFELLNEPSDFYSKNNHEELSQYYRDSYTIIRKYSKTAVVVFNELYANYYSWWDNEMKEPQYYNVIMDWHLYDWQLPHTMESAPQHIQDAVNWEPMIDKYLVQYPIMVGEWCFSTGTFVQAGQAFVDAAVKSFENTAAFYAWNWKVERGIGFDEWDVQYQASLKDGLKVSN